MASSLRASLARVGRWPRIAAAACCLALAASSALGSARPASHPVAGDGVPVVVAARDLPAGHRLVPGDLSVARWPGALRPASASGSPAGFVGATLNGAVARREPITAARVIGPGVLAGLPAGTVATVVAVDRDVGAFVRPGDRIGLLAVPRADPAADAATPPAAAATEVARHVLVVAVGASSSSDDAGSTSLVLATSPVLAGRIAALRMIRTFTAVGESP